MIDIKLFMRMFFVLSIPISTYSENLKTPIQEYLFTYYHPDFGVIDENNKDLILARESCRNEAFTGLDEKDEDTIVLEGKSKKGIAQKNFVDCFRFEKGYQLIRIDLYDVKTGEVIDSMDMRDAVQTY